jgi:hypothetical protein
MALIIVVHLVPLQPSLCAKGDLAVFLLFWRRTESTGVGLMP